MTDRWIYEFWTTLKAALLAAPEWGIGFDSERLEHASGARVRLLSESYVQLQIPGREPRALGWTHEDAHSAALEVVAKVHQRLRELRREATA